jgi:hypothetical protein
MISSTARYSGRGDKKTSGGGIVYTDGLYTVHLFLRSGVFFDTLQRKVDVLVVGGGGGGSTNNGSGGGGGGAVHYRTDYDIVGSSYPIVIAGTVATNMTGDTSSAFGLYAKGGAPGASSDGVNGGGGNRNGGGSGGTIEDYPEWADYGGNSGSSGASYYGGQGGSSGAGLIDITGTPLYWAGGGGGGTRSGYGASRPGAVGGGGAHGGTPGQGGYNVSTGTAGALNTGGGGSGYGTGGSGIVVIRYLTDQT